MSLFIYHTLYYLTKIVFDLYILVIILRFLLQAVKIDFQAPLKDFVFNLTDIPFKFFEKIIPKIWRINITAVFFIVILKMTELILLDLLSKRFFPHIGHLLFWTGIGLIIQLINLYFYLILFRIFISWLIPQHKTRILDTLDKLTYPILGPLRRLVPTIAGFDVSSLIALIILQVFYFMMIGPVSYLAMKLVWGG